MSRMEIDGTTVEASEKAGLLSSHKDPQYSANQGLDEDPPAKHPPSDTIVDKLLYIPIALFFFIERLCLKFGWRYVATLMVVYGFQKGWGNTFFTVANYWFMLDPKPTGLGWSNKRYTMALQVANIPWQIKAIFGMMSDFLPVRGYHRSPYVIIGAVVGVVSGAMLFTDKFHSLWVVCVLLMAMSYSIGVPELVVDATVAENIKRYPQFSTQLQTLCNATYALFAAVMVIPAGDMVEDDGYQWNYFMCIFTSLAILYPGLKAWLGDGPINKQETQEERIAEGYGTAPPLTVTCTRLGFFGSFKDPLRGPVFRLAIFTATLAVAQGFMGYIFDKAWQVGVIGLSTTALLSAGIWHWANQVSGSLAKGMLLIWLTGALQPMSPIITTWMRETNTRHDTMCGSIDAEPDTWEHYYYESKWCHHCSEGRPYLEHGFDRPCLDAKFMSYITTSAYFFSLLGAILYNQYFGFWSYPNIFLMLRLVYIAIGFTDLIWVERWNLYWSIPDKLFVFGQEAIYPMTMMLTTLPYLVMAAQLCPNGVEATLYALITGVSQLSLSTGNYVGVGLVGCFSVTSPDYHGLQRFIVARLACGIFPVLAIIFFCPKGNPKMTPEEMRAVNGELVVRNVTHGYGAVLSSDPDKADRALYPPQNMEPSPRFSSAAEGTNTVEL